MNGSSNHLLLLRSSAATTLSSSHHLAQVGLISLKQFMKKNHLLLTRGVRFTESPSFKTALKGGILGFLEVRGQDPLGELILVHDAKRFAGE